MRHNPTYMAAFARMTATVAAMFGTPAGTDVIAKRTRIGVNVALSNHDALVALLIEKKLITQAEYEAGAVSAMEKMANESAIESVKVPA